MLLAAVVAVSCGVLQVGGTVWVDAHEFGPGAWTPSAAYEGQAWAWAKAGSTVSVSIGDNVLSGTAPAGSKETPYTWAPLGAVAVAAGESGKPVTVQGEGVAAVVLHPSAAEFHPEAFVKDTRVYDTPRAVDDPRTAYSRNLDTVFTMPEYDQAAWEATKDQIRRRMLIGCGLWPLPERTPLNAKIFDRVQHEDYSVEKVHFEARPGFIVTGNLYRPVGNGPFPAVLNPHGHWTNGRLENNDKCSVPGRCITLARMGMIAFSIDMVGYNDSFQFVHHFLQPAFSLYGIHPFSLQLWSSIRALDFLETLPETDKERLACTGASGGGTQTFALTAVDDRVKVAAPVNMISSTMQGGCMCENAPIFRLGISNMEVGAMMAPKPLLLVCATGDWTRETPRVEYPAIRSIFSLYGAEANVEYHLVNAGHNYNQESREAVYRFLGKHLLGGDQWATYTEPPFTVEPEEKLRVFPKGERPEGYPDAQGVIESIKAERRATWAAELPKDEASAAAFREKHRHLLGDMTGATRVEANDLACERVDYEERDGHVQERWILRRKGTPGDAVPAILYRGRDAGPQPARLLVSGAGKAAFAAPWGVRGAPVRDAIDHGAMVLVIDPFLIGEHHSPFAHTKRLQEGFQDTYQMTDTGYRVQDVLTAIGFLRARRDCTGVIEVSGRDGAAPWVLLAGAIDGGLAKVGAFPGDELRSDDPWLSDYYLPGILGVGGVETALYLYDPARTQVFVGAPAPADRWLPANLTYFDPSRGQ